MEQLFREMKSVLETRPVFHQTDEAIRGHVFCSFLALLLMKALQDRLERASHAFEWSDIKRDLDALQEITVPSAGVSAARCSRLSGLPFHR